LSYFSKNHRLTFVGSMNIVSETSEITLQQANQSSCYHCGDACKKGTTLVYQNKPFCCEGCKTVFELLDENGMCSYYDFEKNPGITIKTRDFKNRFDFLNNPAVAEKLLDYADDKICKISFYIPAIHCTSCIWLLENLHKLEPGVLRSEVNFLKKTASFTYDPHLISLKKLVELISSIGYEPEITLEQTSGKKLLADRSFIYKIGVAGFCFGNIMLFSFPEYFHLDDLINPGFRPFFGYLNLLLSIPVLFYSSSGYFISAYTGLKQRIVNIDVPLSLGIAVMFVRSSYEIISGTGAGFMDALAGLVFFLLIGKWFQNRSYKALSFERDYKSYFPLSVTRLENEEEVSCTIDSLREGDIILVRNNELIPADSILIDGYAHIDYSFVTGESHPVSKKSGDKLFAGGRQTGGIIRLQLLKTVSQSYLTSLWNHEVFQKESSLKLSSRTNEVSKYFTLVVLTIAVISAAYWLLVDSSKALNAFTAVLIITCPCALALTVPFTFGNSLRIMGRNHLYLKNADIIEEMAKIDVIVLDKTGTITQPESGKVIYEGELLSEEEHSIIKTAVQSSTHPLSKRIDQFLVYEVLYPHPQVIEFPGQGLECKGIKIGSYVFVTGQAQEENKEFTSSDVHVSVNGQYKGRFRIENVYREGIKELAARLKKRYKIHILSGDHDGERNNLQSLFGSDTPLNFRQTPEMKLQYIQQLQKEGHHVMMLGDGLNDAGALKQSNVGFAVTGKNGTFFPACDGMLRSDSLSKLDALMHQAVKSMDTVRYSFIISFTYNVIGLSFAVRSVLQPVIAAVLMPVSSVSVIAFTVLLTSWFAKKSKL